MFTFDCPSVPAALRFVYSMFSVPLLGDEEQHWDNHAQDMARGPFIMWLANEIATDIILDNPEHQSLDRLIANVDDERRPGHLQHDAEAFLHHQYTRCDPTQRRRIIVFRHLVQRRLKFAK